MNKRYYEHTLPIIRGSLSNTYICVLVSYLFPLFVQICILVLSLRRKLMFFSMNYNMKKANLSNDICCAIP